MPEEPQTPAEPSAPTSPGALRPDDAVSEFPMSRAEQRAQRRVSGRERAAIEWVAVIVVAVLAAFLVRTFVFQTFYIPSGSMEPTLKIGDRIIVSKLSYDIHSIHRGDIVVFHAPAKEATVCADPSVKDLVKRVIGLPGETISSSGTSVLINGVPLAEPWFPATAPGPPIPTTTIPAGQYYVMGDNRSNSCDSRMWGPLPGSDVIGHVVFRIWPIGQIGFP